MPSVPLSPGIAGLTQPRTSAPALNRAPQMAQNLQQQNPMDYQGIADLLKNFGKGMQSQSAPAPIRAPEPYQFTERPRVATTQAAVTAAPVQGPRLTPQAYSQIAARYRNANV